jgi:O-antigen/teichoic acid export membrane protein
MAGRLISFGVVFLIPVLLVRHLSQSDFGLYKQIFLIFNTSFPILQLGMVASLYYFLPESGEARRHYTAQSVLVLASTGTAFFIVANLFGETLLGYANMGGLAPFILPLSVYVALMLVAAPLEALLIIEQRVKTASIIIIISDALRALLMIIPVVMFGNLELMMYAILGAASLRAALLLYHLYTTSGLSPRHADSAHFRSQAAFAAPFALAVAVNILSLEVHQYIVAYSFDPVTFAIYAVGCFQLPLLSIFYESTSTVLMTRITEMQKKGEMTELVGLWKYFQVRLALLFIPIFVFLFIMAREVITILFTDNYLASVRVFTIMVLNVPLNLLLTHTILRSFGESGYILKANIANFLLTVTFIYIFIGLFGIAGAAAGTILGLMLTKVIELLKIRRLCALSFGTLLPWKELAVILAISAGCGLLIKAVTAAASLDSIPSVLLAMAVFSVAYILCVNFSGLLSSEEKESILRNVRRFTPFLR